MFTVLFRHSQQLVVCQSHCLNVYHCLNSIKCLCVLDKLEIDQDQSVGKLRPVNKTPHNTVKETITNTVQWIEAANNGTIYRAVKLLTMGQKYRCQVCTFVSMRKCEEINKSSSKENLQKSIVWPQRYVCLTAQLLERYFKLSQRCNLSADKPLHLV